MSYQKGDLVLIKNLDNNNMTCIVVGCFSGSDYLYCYCIETGLYRLVYHKDVVCVLCYNFDPKFPEDGMFDLDYSFYSACYEAYQYWPSYISDDDDDDEK